MIQQNSAENNLKSKEVQDLKKELKSIFDLVLEKVMNSKFNIKVQEDKKNWDLMCTKAVELHKIAKPTPRHHKYMIKNRGVEPDNPSFYNHIHPIEDLLKFIDDPTANDDPEDQTIDHVFDLTVFSRRWGHDDTYKLKRTKRGWHVSYIAIAGGCDKRGNPYLYKNLNQDSINYPKDLPGYLEWLWDQSEEKGLSHQEVQEALNKLGKWISVCEQNSPDDIWRGYK